MFRRILDMRSKLEGIIQLQTIKYQRQLAIMLRDSKQKQHEQELANAIASANGHPQHTGAGTLENGLVKEVHRDSNHFDALDFSTQECMLREVSFFCVLCLHSLLLPCCSCTDTFPGPGQSPQRVFGHKYPPPIKTMFTPAMSIPESPMTPATGFGTFAHTPGSGGSSTHGSAHGSFGELAAAGERNPLLAPANVSEKPAPPRLGSNIYAGNLKMIGKEDAEAEKRAAAARAPPKESISEKSN